MNIPKLRFKEFNDDYEMKEVADITYNVSSGKISKQLEDGKYNVYGSIGIIGKSNFYDYTGEKVLVARVGANAGSVNKINEKCCISDNTLVLDPKDILNDYLYYSLSHYDPKKLIFGSGQPLVTGGQLKKIKLGIPSKEEQIKTSNFLSLLDKKIELQTKKIEDLKLFKSGQIVKKIKSLDCKEVELKKFGYFISSNSIGKEKITISGVPLILYGDLYTKYSEEITKINQYIKDNEKYIKSEINDLLFPTSTTVDAISLISPSVINIANVVYGGDLLIFKTISSNVNPKFLSYQINHFKRKEFAKKAQGTTIIHIHANDLLSSKVKIPDLNTQILIAHFGNKINKKIELETLKLNKLKSLKKGLMQNLFV